MDEPITYRFTGHLIAETCLATCPPNSTASGKNMPAALPKMRSFGDRVVYFPGGGLRGTLRRHAVTVVRETLRQQGVERFTLDDHFFLVLGGVKGSEKEDKVDILNVNARRQANPIIGLFGSGDPWQKGILQVGSAVPPSGTEIVVVRGARVDDFARSGENLQLLTPDEQQRWVTMAIKNNERSKVIKDQDKLKDDMRRALETEVRDSLKEKIDKMDVKIAELGKNSVNRPLDGYEAIPPGTRMNHSMVLEFANPNEIGLLMTALRFWALTPWIGAHRAHGCGVVSGHWFVEKRIGYAMAYEPVGDLVMPSFNELVGPPELMEAEERFMEALRENAQFDFKYPNKAA